MSNQKRTTGSGILSLKAEEYGGPSPEESKILTRVGQKRMELHHETYICLIRFGWIILSSPTNFLAVLRTCSTPFDVRGISVEPVCCWFKDHSVSP